MRQGLGIFLIIMALLYVACGFYASSNVLKTKKLNISRVLLFSLFMSILTIGQMVTISNEILWSDILWIGMMHIGLYSLLCWRLFYSYVNDRLYHSLQDVIIIMNRKGRIVAVNQAFTKVLGYQQAEVLNMPISLIAQDLTCDVINEARTLPSTFMETNQGSKIPFHVTIIFHGNKKDVYVIGRDIRLIQHLQQEVESRKRVEEEYQKSEALFGLVVKMLPHAIVMTRVEDDVILYVNPRASALFHTTTEEMIGSHAYTYYDDWTNRSNLKAEILATENSILERELLYKKKDGEKFIGQFSVQQAIYKDQSVLLFAIGDVTMQRSLEKAVAQSEQLLRRLMDAIPDFIVVTDLSGNITYANQAVTELLANQVKHFLDFFWANPCDVKKHMERSYEMTYRFEETCVNKLQETCVLGIHANVILDTAQKPFSVIYVMRDVTKRKEMELQLVQSKQEIESMNNKLVEANLKLTEQTIRDSLTGLYNLRYINTILVKEITACIQSQTSLSVMMLDIDHFKAVNDDFGHVFGDEVLIYVARTIESCLRHSDYAGRYGGEEFVVVLPDAGIEQAYKVAQRIKEAVAGTIFTTMNRNVTVSIGVTEWTPDDVNVRDLIKRADDLLYKAKANGRNRVEYD